MIGTKIHRPSIVLGLSIILIVAYRLLVLNIVSPLPSRQMSIAPPLLGTRSAFDDVSTTSNWTTYADLRFSIQYPASWIVVPGAGGALIFTILAHSREEADEALPAVWLYVLDPEEFGPDWHNYIHHVPPYASYLRKTKDKIYLLVAAPYWGRGTDNGRRVSKKVLDRMVNTLKPYQ